METASTSLKKTLHPHGTHILGSCMEFQSRVIETARGSAISSLTQRPHCPQLNCTTIRAITSLDVS